MKSQILLTLFLTAATARADFLPADKGVAKCVILVHSAATVPERTAASELAATLRQITGAEFAIQTNGPASGRSILVGVGGAAGKTFTEAPFDALGAEELIIKTQGNRLLIAGGHPRGTLYAVSRFLQEQCGVRWWTPWASRIPKRETLRLDDLNVRETPAFEYRESFWYPAFDADWSWRNGCNGNSSRLTPDKGGLISYKGFVHTFYPLVPPEQHFTEHPEWFISDDRTRVECDAAPGSSELNDTRTARAR